MDNNQRVRYTIFLRDSRSCLDSHISHGYSGQIVSAASESDGDSLIPGGNWSRIRCSRTW